MNLDFHKLLLKHLKAVCFSVFVVKFYQKMIHHTFRYTTEEHSAKPYFAELDLYDLSCASLIILLSSLSN